MWWRRSRAGPWWSPRCRRCPRFAWPTFDDQRWLLIDLTEGVAELEHLGDSLSAAGVDRFVLVSPGVDSLAHELGLRRVPGSEGSPGVAVVERA